MAAAVSVGHGDGPVYERAHPVALLVGRGDKVRDAHKVVHKQQSGSIASPTHPPRPLAHHKHKQSATSHSQPNHPAPLPDVSLYTPPYALSSYIVFGTRHRRVLCKPHPPSKCVVPNRRCAKQSLGCALVCGCGCVQSGVDGAVQRSERERETACKTVRMKGIVY
jgi:hypothetical protein